MIELTFGYNVDWGHDDPHNFGAFLVAAFSVFEKGVLGKSVKFVFDESTTVTSTPTLSGAPGLRLNKAHRSSDVASLDFTILEIEADHNIKIKGALG